MDSFRIVVMNPVRHLQLENAKKSQTRLFKLDFIEIKLKIF
jgi:hypothetical protein